MRGESAAEPPSGREGPPCQLEAFPASLRRCEASLSEPLSWFLLRRARHLFRKARRITREALHTRAPVAAAQTHLAEAPAAELAPGDRVRVRSSEEILATLDAGGALHGCGFASGMYACCGREFRVGRRVERFFDEARWRMLRGRNLVLLEGVHCDGSAVPDTRGCDRMCFYFWRTEWLEKVE